MPRELTVTAPGHFQYVAQIDKEQVDGIFMRGQVFIYRGAVLLQNRLKKQYYKNHIVKPHLLNF